MRRRVDGVEAGAVVWRAPARGRGFSVAVLVLVGGAPWASFIRILIC